MAGEGQILRNAREQNGWTLLDAEEATKIRVRYLQALEGEDYEVLPGTTYIKGFLRTYAKNLRLNPDEIVGMYKSSGPVESASTLSPPLAPIRNRPLWLRPVAATVMALLAIAVAIGIAHLSQTPKEQAAGQYNPAPVPSAPPVDFSKGQNQAGGVSTQAGTGANKAGNTASGTPVPATTGGQPANQAGNGNNAPAANSDALVAQLVFTEDCWLVVSADGHTVLNGYMYKGTSKVIQANSNIDFVTVGNAGGLSITLNGKPYPSLGGSGQVVNNIILTKNSLK